jgi:uncharacterized membrane protein YccC|tara:strand:+ start:46881 stop:49145 length:2265 start_codon:yes stop_codon:yes gene_type:complete
MASTLPQLQRFFYSHYFLGGLRQATGVIIPALFLSFFFQQYGMAMVAAIGAACVAVIDQPGSPRRYSFNNMIGAVLLGTLTTAVTGLSTTHPILLWFVIPTLCFIFSMFTVYGRQGGLMGFACLFIMTLTMRQPLETHEVLIHTLSSFGGGVFYFAFSAFIHRVFWHREERQALSVALFSTADYIEARSRLYDVNHDLEESYRQLMRTQSAMTDTQQAARNTVLRELPTGQSRSDQQRYTALNIFIDMVALLDTLVATQTDYATLQRTLATSDVLIFARDALRKLANNTRQIALDVARHKPVTERSSVKAEIRAIEYELELYRQNGFAQANAEVYTLLVQVLRRLRNAARIVERMTEHTHARRASSLVDTRLNKTLGRFLTHNELRLGMITSNLRLDSPSFRYAVRVTIAAIIALAIDHGLTLLLQMSGRDPGFTIHGYWIILTTIIVLKPGYALTRQRNLLRLLGTFIGCLLALIILSLNPHIDIYFFILVVACVLGYSMLQLNFMASATFNTLCILLAFNLTAPASTFLIGERLVDTVIGSLVALGCSYILPWWEHNFMGSLAKAARTANHRFYRTGLQYAELNRTLLSIENQKINSSTTKDLDVTTLTQQVHEADVNWRLARKNAYIALGNLTSAFYRMMAEPTRCQKNVPEVNHLLIQNHLLASQISAAVPLLAQLPEIPTGIQQSLDAIDALLEDRNAPIPVSIETEGDLAALAYPIRQMSRAAQLIHQEMQVFEKPQSGPQAPQPQPA